MLSRLPSFPHIAKETVRITRPAFPGVICTFKINIIWQLILDGSF